MISEQVIPSLLTLRSVVRMYADDHQRMEVTVATFAQALRNGGVDLKVDVTPERISLNEVPVAESSRAASRLADVLRQLGIATLVVRCNAPERDLAGLGTLLSMRPAVLLANRETTPIPDSVSVTWAQDPGGDDRQSEEDPGERSRGGQPPRPAGAREEDYQDDIDPQEPGDQSQLKWRANSAGDWTALATKALSERIAQHDPQSTRFLVLCDLFLRAPSAADRNLRRSMVEQAARSESFSSDQLGLALEALANDPESRRAILVAALCSTDASHICRFTDVIDPADANAFLTACAERDDATELLLQLVPHLDSPVWRPALARVLGPRAQHDPEILAQLLAAGDAGRELAQETLARLGGPE